MLQKTVTICGKKVNFRSSASVPRLYRAKFGRDIFKDFSKLEKAYKDRGSEEASTMETEDLEIFENVAYIMAFHVEPSIPKAIDEWLEQFDMFSIYEVLPEILELWGTNLITDVEAKKKHQKSNREITTALFLLRCLEVGLSLYDLDLLTIGMVLDIWTEKGNDGEKYETQAAVREATQHDFDVF